MKNVFIVISFLLALIASQVTVAITPKPVKCPELSELQNANFSLVQEQYDGRWEVADMVNNYDTADTWTFVVFDITAVSKQDAIKVATNGVKNLTFNYGPLHYPYDESWACIYSTATGMGAVAYTPTIDSSNI